MNPITIYHCFILFSIYGSSNLLSDEPKSIYIIGMERDSCFFICSEDFWVSARYVDR